MTEAPATSSPTASQEIPTLNDGFRSASIATMTFTAASVAASTRQPPSTPASRIAC